MTTHTQNIDALSRQRVVSNHLPQSGVFDSRRELPRQITLLLAVVLPTPTVELLGPPIPCFRQDSVILVPS